MALEARRIFSLGHGFTACVPDFAGSAAVTDYLARIGSGDETDSMDPCSAFHFLRAAEPDRSNVPVEHPDYPGAHPMTAAFTTSYNKVVEVG
jgi:hypothetical protein